MTIDEKRHARNDLARGAGNALSSALEWGGTRSILISDHIETRGNASCLVFRDAVATALRGGRRTTFYLIAVPDGRPHSKETP
jgi:hypothetical protein